MRGGIIDPPGAVTAEAQRLIDVTSGEDPLPAPNDENVENFEPVFCPSLPVRVYREDSYLDYEDGENHPLPDPTMSEESRGTLFHFQDGP